MSMYVDVHECILNLKDTLNKLRDDIQRLEDQCHHHFALPKSRVNPSLDALEVELKTPVQVKTNANPPALPSAKTTQHHKPF